ncbi:MAG: response regulator [Microthrixaceae bacterium]
MRSASAESTTPRVLVVDDYYQAALGTKVELEEQGISCYEPYTLLDSVPKELRTPEWVDVVVLDLDMNDNRTLQELLGEVVAWGIPVVVNTAHTHEELRNACFDAGCTGFVGKLPYQGPLAYAVKQAIRGVRFESGTLYPVEGGRVAFNDGELSLLKWLPVETRSPVLSRILNYSPRTIDDRCSQLARKTGHSNRSHLAVWAAEHRFHLLLDEEQLSRHSEGAFE